MVAAACTSSQRQGVRIGMTVAHATAVLPTMPTILDHEPAADAAGLVALARWAMRIVPNVAADPQDGLLLDVAGCERLYGGRLEIARRVRRDVARLRLQVRVAMAPTVGLAWGLARFGDEGVCEDTADLLALPVAALRVDADVVAALAEVGVDYVGQLADIPRREVARRFGDDVLLRLDQATGEAVELRQWQRHVEVPRVMFRFAGPATQYEAIEETVHNLAGQLCERLATHESAARRLVLEVERLDPDLRPTFDQFAVTLAAPSREVRHVWDVLRPRVEVLDMGRGVEALVLSAPQVTRLPHGQVRLDGERDRSRDERDLGRLTDLLQGRLGRGQVLRIEPTPSHVPEAAYRRRPADEPRTPTKQPHHAAGDRPTQLFDPAEPADVTFLQPEGPLATLRWRGASHPIVTTVGPERIGRRWWQVHLSRRSLDVRDYYKLQCHGGLWLWVYRTRPKNDWFVHGVWS
jgi:protein ImuB